MARRPRIDPVVWQPPPYPERARQPAGGHPTSGESSVLAETGGRPLGLEVLPDGDVLVCDSHRGLLRLDMSSHTLTTLVAGVDRTPLRFCSNAVAAPDGTIYFTDSTTRFGFEPSLSGDGHIWVAMVSARDHTVDWLHRSHPVIRRVQPCGPRSERDQGMTTT